MLLSNSQVHVLHLSIIPKLSSSSHGVIVATLFILPYDIGAGVEETRLTIRRTGARGQLHG